MRIVSLFIVVVQHEKVLMTGENNFIDLNVHMESNSISSILTIIKDSNYLSLVSQSTLFHHPNIIGKSLKEGPPSSYISIVYRADHHLTSLIQNFMTLIYSLKMKVFRRQ